MGHVPSIEAVTEPFFMDLYSSKTGCERLAAVALTNRYFKSAEDPLFVKFCQTRSENPVRHWYCRPGDTTIDELPEVPSNEDLYSRFVLDASSVVDQNLPTDKYSPIPIMIVKMDDTFSKPQEKVIPDGNNCAVIGYYGCRMFGSRKGDEPAPLGSCGVMGIFLSTKFYNEAKSLACVQLACACYKHFCEKAGCTVKPWPTFSFKFDTLESNLPCLRLTQKLLAAVDAAGVSCEANNVEIEKIDGRCFFMIHETGCSQGGLVLANKVTMEVAGTQQQQQPGGVPFTGSGSNGNGGYPRRVLRTTPIDLPHGTDLPNCVRNLYTYIGEAKARWSEANAPVVKRQLETGRQARGDGKRLAKEAQQSKAVSEANSASEAGTGSLSSGAEKSSKSENGGKQKASKVPANKKVTTPTSFTGLEAPRSNSSDGVVVEEMPMLLSTAGITAEGSNRQSPNNSNNINTNNYQGGSGLVGIAPMPISGNNTVTSNEGSRRGSRVASAGNSFSDVNQATRGSGGGYAHHPYGGSGHNSPSHRSATGGGGGNGVSQQQMHMSNSANSAFFGSTQSNYPEAHYPRAPMPIQRRESQLSTQQPAYSDYRQQQQQLAPQQTAAVRGGGTKAGGGGSPLPPDPRFFLGDRTPVYVCPHRKKWEARYWRNPMAPLLRSAWQPHLPQFICYEIDHQDLLLYDEFWQPCNSSCEPLVFLEVGESCYTLDENANYVAGRVA